MVNLSEFRVELDSLCKALLVKRLDLVGSAAREDFRPDESDIDVLIEPDGDQDLFDRYFDLKFGLEGIFGRKVDVIQKDAIRNPIIRASIEKDRIPIYEA